ncbi:uncharacterized protein LOC120161731 [Hibiscus syriacus]|uniref:uncharacterized protein LOC120161731 n=1 Tax=Hibiscus syriacus TaxID=106335 RepID=UPI0019216871|nr:uncharacterized protein LOC120161731 [Hibiscus syriacus]
MRTQIYSPNEGHCIPINVTWPPSRKKDDRLKELFDDLESIREEFESIERPILDLENPTVISEPPSTNKSPLTPWFRLKSSLKKTDQKKLKFELEQDDEESSDYETDEIVEWEYDAFEKDLIPN